MKEPESMDEVVYFTNRTIGSGKARCWVLKQKCPKCGKATMGKPRDKSGKVLIRAKEYVCPACAYTAEKKAYEETLTACVDYVCPACGARGQVEVPFKRRKVDGVDTLRAQCLGCKANIDITKKMKQKSEKGGGDED
ncbi:MAG: hypothetical protein V1735_04265 [Nanoarchaeota archaeon]